MCANWLFKVSLLIIHSVSTGTIIRYQTLFHPKVNQQFYYRGTSWLSKGEPTGHLKMSPVDYPQVSKLGLLASLGYR
jgi:hypothetical protein